MRIRAAFYLFVWILLVPALAQSASLLLEQELHGKFLESQVVLLQLKNKIESASILAGDLERLRQIAGEVRIDHMLLQERFKARSERVAILSSRAAERNGAMKDRYNRAVDDFLRLIDSLPPADSLVPTDLVPILDLLDKLLPRKERPLLGSLPYKHLNLPPVSPKSEPTVVPAYKIGEVTPNEADTQGSAAAPITPEIAQLAESLEWNPVRIYEWVQGNIESEWYWGSMKGAAETLRQRSGNDADQAALLVALMRASGYPSRFVRGTIEFFPGLDKAKNLTGLGDPLKIAAYFQKAGIPFEPVIVGGRIVNFRVEHLWVETQVPYSNYRGVVVDENGKIWTALDTHIKPAGYRSNEPADLAADFPLDGVRDDYLAQPRTETPLEYLHAQVEQNAPGTSFSDYLREKSPIDEPLGILPSGLQFTTVAVTGEYVELPRELRQTVTFRAANPHGGELFSLTLDAFRVASRQLTLSYEPEMVDDQRLIDSYGGLDNTPSYLVHLRPVLLLDGKRIVVATDGLPMGADYTLTVTLDSPSGSEEITTRHIVGNLSAVGIACQQAVKPEEIPLEEKDAARLLFEEAIAYIDRWNASEEELASLLKVALVRPLPTVVTVGGVIEVTTLFDTPHGFTWKGVYIDAGLRRVETVAKVGQEEREKQFMRLSALQGSILENRIFENDFGVESVSTAKLLALAPQSLATVITLDNSNVDALLPTLDLAGNVKADIEDAVHQGLSVTVPEHEMNYENWSGVGYIKEDPQTGEAGYMLSGMIAGGMTAWGVGAWNDSVVASLIAKMLENPFTGRPNTDPSSAAAIEKIAATDLQKGKIGENLPSALQVRVLDEEGKAVEGAEVVFNVLAGGGCFNGEATEVAATTNSAGIASVVLTLGKHTGDNPTYWQETGKIYAQQIGENLVTASLETLSRPTVTFTSFGLPDDPDRILFRSADGLEGDVLSYVGPVAAVVVDKEENPLANVTLKFAAKAPQPREEGQTCAVPPAASPAKLTIDPACGDLLPTRDECQELTGTREGLTGSTVEVTTQSDGLVWVGVILGDRPNASYPIIASITKEGDPDGLPKIEETITRRTRDTGSCGEGMPENVFFLKQTNREIDATGRSITARKVEESFDVRVKAYVLSEGEANGSETFTCNGETKTCTMVVGNGQFSVESLDDLVINYYSYSENGVVGELLGTATPLGNGLYEGQITLKSEPGVNAVYVKASTSKTVTRSFNGCDGCSTGPFELHLGESGQIGVFGVDFEMPEQFLALVDKEGRVVVDTPLDFSILPASYQAGSAQLLVYKDYRLVAVLPTEKGGEASATLARGFRFEPDSEYKVQVVLNYGWQSAVRSEKIPLYPYNFPLVPDYNHNRGIDDEDSLRAAKGDTYYFWINDDDDFGETGGNDIPIAVDDPMQNTNAEDSTVNGVRDLIDFFPVHLDLQSLFKVFSPSWHTYKIRNEDYALNFFYSDLGADNAGDYLTKVPLARDLGDEHVEMVSKISASMGGQIDTTLSSSFLEQISSDLDKGVILVEGIRKTQKPLFLDIYDDNGEKVFSCWLNVRLDSVEQMFRQKNIIQAALPELNPQAPKHLTAWGEPDRLEEPTNCPDDKCLNGDGSDFVFVHGYNIDGQQARGWQAETFKRLYWSGLKSRFWGVTWYGSKTQAPVIPITFNYHINVRNALHSAPALRLFLNAKMKGPTTIAAHSLGNMLVASALIDPLKDKNNNDISLTAPISNVFMIDAAVPLEAFTGELEGGGDPSYSGGDALYSGGDDPAIYTAANPMVHPDWYGYAKKLGAGEWYKHFKVDVTLGGGEDQRQFLTFRNRFGNLSGANFYNFYSSGEEVLDTHTGVPNVSDIATNGAGRYAWALQEKLKGEMPTDLVLGSAYGGWGFNLSDGYSFMGQHVQPSIANTYSPDPLRSAPFFIKDPSKGNLFMQDLGVTIGEDERNEILADQIPATTLPAGGPGGKWMEKSLLSKYVINMQATFTNGWPQERIDKGDMRWKHSDLRNVSYLYIYEIFKKLIDPTEVMQ